MILTLYKKAIAYTDQTVFVLYDDILCYQKCPCDTIYYDQGNKNVIIIDASLRIDRYCKFQMAFKFSN